MSKPDLIRGVLGNADERRRLVMLEVDGSPQPLAVSDADATPLFSAMRGLRGQRVQATIVHTEAVTTGRRERRFFLKAITAEQ
jgi:hypothetical protein